MVMNDVIAEKIIERAPSPQIVAAARSSGLRLLREDGWVKVRAGETTPRRGGVVHGPVIRQTGCCCSTLLGLSGGCPRSTVRG